jgi:hypothetical protein
MPMVRFIERLVLEKGLVSELKFTIRYHQQQVLVHLYL